MSTDKNYQSASEIASPPDTSTQKTVIAPCEISSSFFDATIEMTSALETSSPQTEVEEGTALQSQQDWKKYEAMQELARGGMGRVMLWKDRNLNRIVASKLILQERQSSAHTIQRFLEEGQITGQLEHPNIVPIYEMGVDEKTNLYFTMKYMKGQTLKALLAKLNEDPMLCEQEWPLRRRLSLFQSICHAIDYAHSKKVIHRDLKPDNIMLGDFGEVMVMDWGLAKVTGQGQEVFSDDSVTTLRSEGGFKTITGQIAGTPLYMSPEQAGGEIENLDYRSDIYSLGVILYELVTGVKCVEGETLLDILAKVTRGKIQEMPVKGPFGYVPKELRAIVKKALRFDKQKRYQSARDLAEDIQRFVDGREVKACSYSLWDRSRKVVHRFRRELALVAVTIFILLPTFLVWHHFQTEKEIQREIDNYVDRGEDALQNDEYLDALKTLASLEQETDSDTMRRKTVAHRDKNAGQTATPLEDDEEEEKEDRATARPIDLKSRPLRNRNPSVNYDDETVATTGMASEALPPLPPSSSNEPVEAGPAEKPQPETREKLERKQESIKQRRAENFTKVKDALLKTVEIYRKGYERSKNYKFKKKEANAWVKMYRAACYAEDAGWQEISRYQVKSLVTEEEYQTSYRDRLSK